MALHALGKVTVTTAGTPVQATVNQSVPSDRIPANAVLIEAWSANTGKVYVGDRSTMNKSTGAGVLAILGIPTTNFIASFSATLPYAAGALNVADLWIDADTSSDAVIVSYVAG